MTLLDCTQWDLDLSHVLREQGYQKHCPETVSRFSYKSQNYEFIKSYNIIISPFIYRKLTSDLTEAVKRLSFLLAYLIRHDILSNLNGYGFSTNVSMMRKEKSMYLLM